MAKKKKTKRSKPQASQVARRVETLPPEDRRAEAVTVAWMLSLLATAAALILSVGLRIVPEMAWGSDALSAEVRMLPRLLIIVAVITGSLCLVLTPVVHRFRKLAPPRQITFAAVVAGIVPWIIIVGMYIAAM